MKVEHFRCPTNDPMGGSYRYRSGEWWWKGRGDDLRGVSIVLVDTEVGSAKTDVWLYKKQQQKQFGINKSAIITTKNEILSINQPPRIWSATSHILYSMIRINWCLSFAALCDTNFVFMFTVWEDVGMLPLSNAVT
jgi:hypothetical protein